MNIIDRYIGRAILEASLIALLVLLGMQSFIEFIGELSDIGTHNYGVLQALMYVPLQLPGDLYQFFPIAALVGVVMGLGRLASSSELIVMRAAGISILRILMAVFKIGIIMLVVVTLAGEWLAPHWQAAAEKRKIQALTGQSSLTQFGTWVRDGDNFIHINIINPDNSIRGVMRYQFDNHRLLRASYAETGQYKHGHWTFHNISESEINDQKIGSQHFAEQHWDITFNPRFLKMTTTDPNKISLPKLYQYIQYLKENAQSSNQVEFHFWKRIFQPLATLIMMGLGVPFVFGPLRNATMGFRIVTGIGIGVAFYILNEFFGPFSMVYQFPPFWAALIPSLLFAVGGMVLLVFTR